MKISEADRDLIARVGLHADESLRQLARRAKRKVHTVRYGLERLRSRGILKRIWTIDVLALGWLRFEIFFASGVRKRSNREKFIQFLIDSPRVSFLAETGGSYDFEIIILGHCSHEVSEFFETCTKLFGETMSEKAIVMHETVSYFPRKYLAQGTPPVDEISMGDRALDLEIDSLDEQLLELLGKQPDISRKDLAAAVSRSAITVDARLARLTEQGILRGSIFSVDASHFGGQNFILLVKISGFDGKMAESLRQFVKLDPHCTNFRRCFGNWDFEIGVEVLHHRQVTTLKEELYERFGQYISEIGVVSRFKVHKYAPYPLRSSSPVKPASR